MNKILFHNQIKNLKQRLDEESVGTEPPTFDYVDPRSPEAKQRFANNQKKVEDDLESAKQKRSAETPLSQKISKGIDYLLGKTPEQKADWWAGQELADKAQDTADMVSLGAAVTGVGEPASIAIDGGNAFASVIRAADAALHGEFGYAGKQLANAGGYAIGAIPFAGTGVQAARGARIGKELIQQGTKEAAQQGAKETGQQVSKNIVSDAAQKTAGDGAISSFAQQQISRQAEGAASSAASQQAMDAVRRVLRTNAGDAQSASARAAKASEEAAENTAKRTENISGQNAAKNAENRTETLKTTIPTQRKTTGPSTATNRMSRRSQTTTTGRVEKLQRGLDILDRFSRTLGTGQQSGSSGKPETYGTKFETDLISGQLGQFQPTESGSYSRSTTGKMSADAAEKFGRWPGNITPVTQAMNFYRPAGAIINDSYDPKIEHKIRRAVKSYLKSKEGQHLDRHLENIKKELARKNK